MAYGSRDPTAAVGPIMMAVAVALVFPPLVVVLGLAMIGEGRGRQDERKVRRGMALAVAGTVMTVVLGVAIYVQQRVEAR